MAKQTVDRDIRRALDEARKMIAAISEADSNEAETRRRVERIFETVMGYDAFKHLSRERSVHGAGETEYCDFAIHVAAEEKPVPDLMVELKRVNYELAKKDLKQVVSYAIDTGCEWVLLTNGRQWQLHHVEFTKPPQTTMLFEWNLMTGDYAALADRFALISLRSVQKGALADLWRKVSVLTTRNLMGELLGEESIRGICRRLKKSSGVTILPEDVTEAFRKLLNEAALGDLECVLTEGQRRRTSKRNKPAGESAGAAVADAPAAATPVVEPTAAAAAPQAAPTCGDGQSGAVSQ